MDEKRKKSLRYAIILLIGFYVFALLFYAHAALIAKENHLSFGGAIPLAYMELITKPLAIFPLPGDIARNMIFLLLILLVATYLIYIIDKVRRGYYDQENVQGKAKWLSELDDYNRKFTEPFGETSHDGKNNMILSQDIYLSMDNQKTRRNMNTFIIGGSGAGKSYNYVGPNLMQANASYVITDPSGGLFKEYGSFFEAQGYHVKCFNLDHMERGNTYNPFKYINSDKDVEILVTTLISNTTPKDKQGGDPFWEKSETALLVALISMLHNYAIEEMQNFETVMAMLRRAEVDEDHPKEKSELDLIFDAIEEKDPDSFAVKQYKTFKMGAGKTLKSILISCAVRLQAFDLSDVADLTNTDTIDLDSVGDEKTALFVIIPTGEKTFNFLASMMYSQLFQRLYGYCENTAEFSTLIVDSDDQLIKTFRAGSSLEMKERKKEAEAFFERAKKGTIVKNENFNWYGIETEEEELVTWRATEQEAQEALVKIRHGRVKSNSEQSNHGQRLPIHTRLMLDEFANIGKIPEFPEKVATIRKYELSVAIILQSLTQLKKMYKDEWSELSGNCDNTIYLGGGADADTTEWISKLLGKETRTIVNATFSRGGGSTSLNKQGVELYSPDELRTMPEDECIVIPKSNYAYKGKKFMSDSHPVRAYVKSLDPYSFDPLKAKMLLGVSTGVGTKKWGEDQHDGISTVSETEEDLEDQISKNKMARASEFQNNMDADGCPIIPSEQDLDEYSSTATRLNIKDKAGLMDELDKLVTTTERAWGIDGLMENEVKFSYREAEAGA